MRRLVLLFSLAVWLPLGHAQEQEGKLVNRLLQPNMELQNSAQGKKFVADHGGAMDKKANVGSFYVQEKPKAKQFTGTRSAPAREFHSENFRGSEKAANATSPREIPNAQRSVATPNARDVKEARDSDKIVDSREYSGKRPYLERGKSQKSLERHNPPMTIDEVRELLNKNK